MSLIRWLEERTYLSMKYPMIRQAQEGRNYCNYFLEHFR